MPRLRRRVLLAAVLAAPFAARPARAQTTLRVGVMSGDGEMLMERVAAEALPRGLALKLVVFSDYLLPNEALDRGEIDANAFQHQPYLDRQVQARGYRIVAVGKTVVAPIGLYSRKFRSVAALPKGGQVGIPNDPSNGGRALNLLAAQGLLGLRPGAGIAPSPLDIIANPRELRIVELDAGIIGRALEDLDAAVVNNDWALKAGIGMELRIAAEAVEGNPYSNVIAVRAGRQDDPAIRMLVACYHSEAMRDFILSHYKGRQLPAW